MAVHPRKDGHCYLAAMRTARPRAAVGLAVCALTFLTASPAHAATLPSGFGERTLASGLTRPTAVAWAPDGERIASGSWDKTVQVWRPDMTPQ